MADPTYNKLDPSPEAGYYDIGYTPKSGDPPLDLEKAYRNHLAREKWGPDAPWSLPEELVGDWLYRHQGVILHTGLAALPHNPPPIRAGNLGYALYSLLTGRTQRPQIGEGGIPLDPGEQGLPPQRTVANVETPDEKRDRNIKGPDPRFAMHAYGGVNWPWDTDVYGTRKGDPGVPPLPGAPY